MAMFFIMCSLKNEQSKLKSIVMEWLDFIAQIKQFRFHLARSHFHTYTAHY